jgi:hypothetical protein
MLNDQNDPLEGSRPTEGGKGEILSVLLLSPVSLLLLWVVVMLVLETRYPL